MAGPNGIVTSRTRPQLLGLRATLSPDGEPLVENRPAGSPEVAAVVQHVAGPDAQLARLDTTARFDVLPLLIATDGAIKAFGRDGRRLRPNIVLGGVEGLAERGWEGRRLRIGEVVIRLDSLRARCVMTTFHPDTLVQDVDVLRDISARFLVASWRSTARRSTAGHGLTRRPRRAARARRLTAPHPLRSATP